MQKEKALFGEPDKDTLSQPKAESLRGPLSEKWDAVIIWPNGNSNQRRGQTEQV